MQAAHKLKDGGAVTLAHIFTGIEAQTDVVIPPDAYSPNLLKHGNRLLDLLPHLEYVAQDNEALGPMPLQHGDGLSQLLGLFVDVR
jgi:hypothetical protein